MPRVRSPLSKHAVATALAKEPGQIRIMEGPAGRWTESVLKARAAAAAERHQRQTLKEHRNAAMLLTSNDDIEKRRAELILKQRAVTDALIVAKAKHAKAKSNAYEGRYMKPSAFRQLEAELVDLKQQSVALNVALGEIKKDIKERNIERSRSENDFFRTAAKQLLEDGVFAKIAELANELGEKGAT